MTDQLRLDGRVAVVTGAGRGLGRAYAKLLAERGARVIVNDTGQPLYEAGADAAPADEVVREIREVGGEAQASYLDIAAPDAGQALVRQALDAFGRIDIIVNNAGNFRPQMSVEETTPADMEAIWKVHVLAPFNLIRAAWPAMKAQNYGRIINIGSAAGYYGMLHTIPYSVAKAAIHGMSRSLSFEGEGMGIKVNLIAPSAWTRPVAALSGELLDRAFGSAEAASASSAYEEAWDPAWVAPAILWLAHEDCPVNGEAFQVAGGYMGRVVIAETDGHWDLRITPESIRDAYPGLMDTGPTPGLTFPLEANENGARMLERRAKLVAKELSAEPVA